MNRTGLRERVATLIEQATGSTVPAASALASSVRAGSTAAGGPSLTALGMDSLGFLRLIDAIEDEYGVELDLGGQRASLDTLDGIVAGLLAQGVPAWPAPGAGSP